MERTSTALSLAAAAAAIGKNKTTVLRAIKSGRISGTKTETGEWFVEPVELHRVFAPAAVTSDAMPHHAAVADAELSLRARLAEERLSDLKIALDEMRAQRDQWQTQAGHWQAQAERLSSSLPRPRPKPVPRKRSWWQFRRS
jgi:hypothetical protein